jgi:lipid A 3-O-deacylase
MWVLMKKTFIYSMLVIFFLLTSNLCALASKEKHLTEKPWSVLSGYGITHNGMGKTQINVETIDLVVGYEKFLTNTFGPSLLKGRHSFVVEVPLHFVVDPWEDPMIGMNFLARWTFETNRTIKPYVFGGGGPVYTEAKIQGLGANLNGNWQFGVGFHFPTFNNNLVFEYRFHHISNLNTKDPNDSLNSSKVLLGIRF